MNEAYLRTIQQMLRSTSLLDEKMVNQNKEKIGNKIIQNTHDSQNRSIIGISSITRWIRESSVIRR